VAAVNDKKIGWEYEDPVVVVNRKRLDE